MGKHEPMSAKAIANRIKAKGLQKIKYYCEMCKKQCRDDNGFKCHIQSESHQRQALIISENPDKFVNEFSKEFMDGFIYLLRTRYRFERVLANTVFQEYIKEKDHIHMNGTRWTSLTEFANWLGQNGIVRVDDSERGVMVTYIDRDPETLRRLELDAKKAQQAKEAAERKQREIELQIQANKKFYEELESEKQKIEPIHFEKVPVVKSEQKAGLLKVEDSPKSGDYPATTSNEQDPDQTETIERPMFKVKTFSIKTTTSSNYRPPPPKRKVIGKKSDVKKRLKQE